MDIQNFQFILVIISLIIGMISAIYFYQSTGIFVTLLQRPLRLISSGMIVISFGILMAVFISFYQNQGYSISVFGVPITAFFFLMYIVGSIMILIGARQFSRKPV